MKSPQKPAILRPALSLLCSFMLLAVFACGNEGKNTETSKPQTDENQKPPFTFTLPYHPAETFNPYTVTDRLNYDIMALVHDGLVSVGQDYSVHNGLAADFVMSDSTLTFTLRDDVLFHDGSPLKAADVEYSFTKAKESSRFALTFAKVRSFRAESENIFTVELTKPYERALSLFTFPIVKNGSLSGQTLPVGCGRYILVKEASGCRLLANSRYYNGKMSIADIKLSEILDSSSLYSALGSGIVHGAYTDMTKSGINVKGNVELRDFPENKLVFLGLNASKSYFSLSDVKKAISLAIDRSFIIDSVMLGHAEGVNRPFNPQWGEAGLTAGAVGRSTAEAEELLDRAGLKAGTDGNRIYNGKLMEFKIIVNSENRMRVQIAETISKHLKSVGLTAAVEAMKQDDYKKALSNRSFDMYIGEVKLPNDMDISPLLLPTVNFTGRKSIVLENAIHAFNIGELDINELSEVFDNEMPMLPLFYKNGTLIITRQIGGSHQPTFEDIFKGIETYTAE